MKVLFILLCVFLISTPPVSAQDNAPVLVELFTAEDCPACPPADEYLAKIAKSPNVIALACHVHYFGKGTADLGKIFCSKRQATYAAQLGQKKYYTPQAMINGTVDEIGYKSAEIAAHITQAQKNGAQPIQINQTAIGVFDYQLAARQLRESVELWLAVYNQPVRISKRGVTRDYTHAVQFYTPLGMWAGEASKKAVFPILDDKAAGFVIAAQNRRTGEIMAVGEYKLDGKY